MKKKFLTLALTASMVLGSAFSAFAAETKIDKTTLAADSYSEQANPLQGKNASAVTITYTINWDAEAPRNGWDGVFAFYDEATGGRVSFQTAPYICFNADRDQKWIDLKADAWCAKNCEAGKDYTFQYVITADSISVSCDGNKIAEFVETGRGTEVSATGYQEILDALNTYPTLTIGVGIAQSSFWNTELCTISITINDGEETTPAEDTTTAAENESTTVPSSNGKDPEVEPTTVPSSNGKDPEVEPTTVPSSNGKDPEAEPTTGEENTSAPAAEDEAGVVSAEVVAEIAKSAVVEGAPEGAKLEVNAIAADSEEYSLAKKFVTDELKAKAWAVLDLKLVDAENAVIQPDGKVKITLPVFENIKDAKYVAVYRLDDSKFTHLSTSEVKDGKFTFETDHFSTYLFASVDNPATDSTVDGSETTTGDTAPIAGMMVAALAAVGAVVLVSTKKKNA